MKLFIPNETEQVAEICCDASTRAEFKLVVQHLCKQFHGVVTDKAEGPDLVAWQLLVEGKAVAVSLSDWGPFPLSVSSDDATAKNLITRLGESLENV